MLLQMVLHRRRDLRSLPDLKLEHVPLLKNIKQKACKASVVWVASQNQAGLDMALDQHYVSNALQAHTFWTRSFISSLETYVRHMQKNTKYLQVINDKFGVTKQQIRAYIHYHPTYYHLHVHFIHVSVDVGAGMAVGKAHLLDDVIGKCIASHSLLKSS